MAFRKLRILLDMIKFEHTVLALPFAYLGMVLGAQGLPSFSTFCWITCAMVGANSRPRFSLRLATLASIRSKAAAASSMTTPELDAPANTTLTNACFFSTSVSCSAVLPKLLA